MRSVALDVHRDFCQVAIAVDGRIDPCGRIATDPDVIADFARSLDPSDVVVMEMTGNAVAIAGIIEPYVAEVILADAKATKAVTKGRAKTDRIDACVLARLHAGGFLPRVWAPDERTRSWRRLVSRRAQLVRQRTREKNQLHAVLHRNLIRHPGFSDLFGVAGRQWLATLEVAFDERLTLDGCLRQIDALSAEIVLVEEQIGRETLASEEMRLLLTIPGVNALAACALLGAIGDVTRFRTPRQLVAYLGLDPRVEQSGSEPARHGRISKQGPGEVRHVLVEAAWHLARTIGPLRVFHERVRARRGVNVATVAVARKLVVIVWHMLNDGEPYAYARPSLTREKIRRLELRTGADRRQGHRSDRVWAPRADHDRERELATQAETAYRRLTTDWQAAGPGRRGRGCRTGARIVESAEATSSAAGESPKPALELAVTRTHQKGSHATPRSST
jgi:transposase